MQMVGDFTLSWSYPFTSLKEFKPKQNVPFAPECPFYSLIFVVGAEFGCENRKNVEALLPINLSAARTREVR